MLGPQEFSERRARDDKSLSRIFILLSSVLPALRNYDSEKGGLVGEVTSILFAFDQAPFLYGVYPTLHMQPCNQHMANFYYLFSFS